MLNTDSYNESEYKKFRPPKLPFGWLVTIFIAPAAVIVLPNIFTNTGISLLARIIAALLLLSALLFTSCIILTLESYDRSYTLQILQYTLERESEQIKALEGEIARQTAESSKMLEKFSEFEHQYDALLREKLQLELQLKNQKWGT